MRVGKRHLQRIEGEVDVGAVLVAAGGEIALDEPDGVLSQRAAVFAGARPIGIGDLGDDLAAFLERLENGPDVEVLVEGCSDAYFNVVEVDENGDVDAFLVCQNLHPSES